MTLNIGARNDKKRSYDRTTMKADATDVSESVRAAVRREVREAVEWHDERGNAGDNVPLSVLEGFGEAVESGDISEAVDRACDVLETQMHPTARDIVGGPIKQFVYNSCGRRAYRYEVDDK